MECTVYRRVQTGLKPVWPNAHSICIDPHCRVHTAILSIRDSHLNQHVITSMPPSKYHAIATCVTPHAIVTIHIIEMYTSLNTMTDRGEVLQLLHLTMLLRLKTNIPLEVLYLRSTLLPRSVIDILLTIVLFRTTPSSSLWTLVVVVVPDARHALRHAKRRFYRHNYLETGLNPHLVRIAKWIEIKPVWSRFEACFAQSTFSVIVTKVD